MPIVPGEYPHLLHPKYRPDIDGLRALAILSVIGFHYYPVWLPGGFIGVDVFFVISGYLISTIIFNSLSSESFSFSEFYARRIKRIYPALLVVLVACYLYGWLVLFADEYKHLGKHISAGAFFVSNLALWLEAGYFDTVAESKPLLHLWSLGIEEQFYIFWPLIAVLLWRQRSALPWLIVALLVTSFVLNVAYIGSDPVGVFYLPMTRAWELLAGTLLSHVVRHPRHKQYVSDTAISHNLLSSLGLLLILLALVMVNPQKEFPGWWAILPVAGTCLLIAAGTKSWLNRRVLSYPGLIWFGLISYPLYLWHWPILAFFRMTQSGEFTGTGRLALILLSVGLAWLTYRFVERPLRFGAVNRSRVKPLFITMSVIGIIGFITVDQSGFESRKANSMGLITAADWPAWYRYQRCFIDTKNGTDAFVSECDGVAEASETGDLVLLWGDSHAASLYPGLKKQAALNGFYLAQFTENGCPPVLGFVAKKTEPQCRDINEYILKKIEVLRPSTIILAGYWTNYDGTDHWSPLSLDMIRHSLERLLNGYGGKVVLVGQLPVSDISQVHVGARHFVAQKNMRSFNHFRDSSFAMNRELHVLTSEQGISFVSPTDLLCNDSGCLLSTTPDKLEPVAWDYGHLSKSGSEFLIGKAISNGLLRLPGRAVLGE